MNVLLILTVVSKNVLILKDLIIVLVLMVSCRGSNTFVTVY